MIRDIFYNEEGQALTEYALIIALIAIGIVVALRVLGNQIDVFFQEVAVEWPI